MQHELKLIGPVPDMQRVPSHLVSLCRSSGEAVLLAIRYGKRNQSKAAFAIGMTPAQLSRIISGNAHMPADKATEFAYYVKNWGWQQWIAFSCGMDMVPRSESPEEKMARLEARVAELEAA